jgi:hypothetical protein
MLAYLPLQDTGRVASEVTRPQARVVGATLEHSGYSSGVLQIKLLRALKRLYHFISVSRIVT